MVSEVIKSTEAEDRAAIMDVMREGFRNTKWEQLSVVELRNLCTSVQYASGISILRSIKQRSIS